jgi:hypothetical protein
MTGPGSPLKAGLNPVELLDPQAEADAEHQLDMKDLFTIAEQIRNERMPPTPGPKKNILVISGGGAYGAYCAGVLAGWTDSGTRPEFDVVTGISTGALIAPLAFLGSQRDAELRELYTNMNTRDVFRIKKTIRSLFSESLADATPLAKQIERSVTPDLLRAIAVEHARGRRLYVGTTELESRRPVIWDLGEIATRGTMEDLTLFRRVILASASIPGFFAPVRIPVTVNGVPFEERHIDGGVSNSLFFRPPYLPKHMMGDPANTSLNGSTVHILVAGKLYADPSIVSPRALSIAGNSVSTLIYSQTRGDLLKLYTACILTGMNYRLSAIPAEFDAPESSTDFSPEVTRKMFDEGYRQAVGSTAWRMTPPGLERGEGALYRSGVNLTQFPNTEPPLPGPREKSVMERLMHPFNRNGSFK